MQDVFKLKEIVRKKKVAKHRKRKLNVLKEYVKNTLMAIKQIYAQKIPRFGYLCYQKTSRQVLFYRNID